MGMYDVINGDQVKMFTVCYPVLQDDGNIEFRCSGGELKEYGNGAEVPWKRNYYNIGKNFDIVDMFSDDYDFDAGTEAILIHQIRNGKVFASVPYDKHNGIFEFDAYTSYGIKFKSINKAILADYKEKILYLQKLRTPSNKMVSELNKYHREHGKDKDASKKIEEMIQKIEKQRKKDYDEFILPVHEKMREYMGEDFLSDKFDNEQKLGIYVDALVGRDINFEKFVVYDERLKFIAFATEMVKVYEKVNLKHYFERFEISEDEQVEFEMDVEMIIAKLDTVRRMKFKKEQFVANALQDLENKRFGKAYKKYNVIPFED